MSALINNIRQNAEYFCKKAMEAFEAQDYLLSIKYLNSAARQSRGEEKYEIYFILGLMYNRIGMNNRSNEYFLMSTFSYMLQVKAFMSIFENMIEMDRLDLAGNYRTILSYHPHVKKEELENITTRFNEVSKAKTPKIREIGIEDLESFRSDYAKALDMICNDDIDGAIELLSKYDYTKSYKIKDLLTTAYAIKSDYQNAFKVIYSSELSIEDKCNLMLSHYFLNDEEEVSKIVDELMGEKSLSVKEKYLFAVRLLKVNRPKLSVEVFEDYFKYEPYDVEARIVYSIACMECGKYDTAKNTLLTFKELAVFDVGVYDELLKKCEKKETIKSFNTYNISELVDKKYKARINWLLDLDDSDFEKNVKKYEKEILWLAVYKDKYLRNNFFKRYAVLEGIEDVVNKILISSEVDNVTKSIIIKQRLNAGYNEDVIFTKDEMFVGFLALDSDLADNRVYLKTHALLVQRIIDGKEQGLFDFTYFFRNAVSVYKDLDNPYILAAIISFEIDRKLKRRTVKSICNYYGISEEDFWKYYKGE